jgi:CRP/FNR family transcriptional regulator, cyclic AMP receptor protein
MAGRSSRSFVDERLKQIPLFASCSQKELRDISRRMTTVDVEAGTVLAQEGKLGSEFVVIVDGTAKVSKNGRKVAELGSGDYFGEVALLDDRHARTATVTAASDMTIEVVDVRDFNALLDDQPRIATKLLAGLAKLIHEG